MIFALVFEAVMFGLEISAAGYRMDTFTMIRGCTQLNKILLTVGRRVGFRGADSLGVQQ